VKYKVRRRNTRNVSYRVTCAASETAVSVGAGRQGVFKRGGKPRKKEKERKRGKVMEGRKLGNKKGHIPHPPLLRTHSLMSVQLVLPEPK
jgi:hypothetical protein